MQLQQEGWELQQVQVSSLLTPACNAAGRCCDLLSLAAAVSMPCQGINSHLEMLQQAMPRHQFDLNKLPVLSACEGSSAALVGLGERQRHDNAVSMHVHTHAPNQHMHPLTSSCCFTFWFSGASPSTCSTGGA